MVTRAAIYLRISQDPNEDGLAVARQKGDCEHIAELRGWAIYAVYQDTLSASKRNVRRPAYESMIAAYERGEFDSIICYDLDRLTRQPRQLEDLIDLAESNGLVVVTANGEADLGTDAGRTFARVKAAFARGEIERKGARQKAKSAQNVARGYPVPGKRRFGFESGNIRERAVEANTVRALYAGIAAGDSIKSWADRMDKPTVRVREILTNPSYAGWVVRHGEKFEAAEDVARVVDRDLWESVQILISDPARKTSPGNQPKHLASGIARCSVCGGGLVKIGPNYACVGGRRGHPCIKVETLDDWLITAVQFHLAMWADESTDDGQQTELKAQIDAIDEQIDNGLDVAMTVGGTAAVKIKVRIQKLEEERAALSNELSRVLAASLPLTSLLATGDEDVPYSIDLSGNFDAEWERMTIDRKRELVRRLIKRVTVAPGRGTDRITVEPNRPPSWQREAV